MEGWIQLHRQLLVSDIFHNEKMLKVFVYCLLKASHKEHKQKVGRQTVELKPGQFVFGRKKASIELNMNESTLRDYMYALRDDNTIDINSANKFSVITIVNWELYQSKEENSDNKYDNKRTAKGQQKDTNNNGNNVNNGNKDNIPFSEIVSYLNDKADKKFRPTTKKTKEVIKARWSEGFREDDFFKVIDICCLKWKGQKFNNGAYGDDYLQPSTLFNNKFEERLNWTDKVTDINTRKVARNF